MVEFYLCTRSWIVFLFHGYPSLDSLLQHGMLQVWKYMLGRDNSSHDRPVGSLLWTHSQGTHGLGPTNPQAIGMDLHTILDEFHCYPKPYGNKRITHYILYTSLQTTASLFLTVIVWIAQVVFIINLIVLLGVFVLMIAIPLAAKEKASAEFVFTHFNTDNSNGIKSRAYIFVLGLLMSQYTLTGYDASAHMVRTTSLNLFA